MQNSRAAHVVSPSDNVTSVYNYGLDNKRYSVGHLRKAGNRFGLQQTRKTRISSGALANSATQFCISYISIGAPSARTTAKTNVRTSVITSEVMASARSARSFPTSLGKHLNTSRVLV